MSIIDDQAASTVFSRASGLTDVYAMSRYVSVWKGGGQNRQTEHTHGSVSLGYLLHATMPNVIEQ